MSPALAEGAAAAGSGPPPSMEPEARAAWAVLLRAARGEDRALAAALRCLLHAGARLDAGPAGGMTLRPGAMAAAAYEAVRRAELVPRQALLARLLRRLRAPGDRMPAARVDWSPPPVEVVEDAAALLRVLADTARHPLVGVDVETAPRPGAPQFDPLPAALDPRRGAIRLLQIATAERVYVTDAFRVPLAAAAEPLREWLAAPGCRRVMQNGRFDLQMLRAALGGAPLPAPRVGDVMLWSRLLACGQAVAGGHGLQALAARHLGADVPKAERESDWAAPSLSREQLAYAARDSAVLVPLAVALRRRLRGLGLLGAARLEDACLPAVADMEYAGIGFDLAYAAALAAEVREAADLAARRARELLGGGAAGAQVTLFGAEVPAGGINLGSPEQVRAALRRIGIEVPKTDDDALRPLAAAHPAVAALLAHRRLAKLLSAFCEAVPRFVHPSTGRVHPRYSQITGVGRLSSSSFNIQQVPRQARFRRAFAAPPGRCLVVCDLSAIEMRIMAKLSGDPELTRVFAAGEDPHRRTAAVVTGKPEGEISHEERQMAKPVNFGFIYGMSAAGRHGDGGLRAYARNAYGVEMTVAEAERYRQRFFDVYRGIAAFHRHQERVARPAREVRTLSGRLRRWSHDRMLLTELANTPTQGTGADILKRAMAGIRPHLARLGGELVASVHDELLVECPEAVGQEMAALLRREMIEASLAYIAPVAAGAEAGVGRSWADKG